MTTDLHLGTPLQACLLRREPVGHSSETPGEVGPNARTRLAAIEVRDQAPLPSAHPIEARAAQRPALAGDWPRQHTPGAHRTRSWKTHDDFVREVRAPKPRTHREC